MPDFINSLLIHAIVHFTHLFFINISSADSNSIAKWMPRILWYNHILDLFSDFCIAKAKSIYSTNANVCHMPLNIVHHVMANVCRYFVRSTFSTSLKSIHLPFHLPHKTHTKTTETEVLIHFNLLQFIFVCFSDILD